MLTYVLMTQSSAPNASRLCATRTHEDPPCDRAGHRGPRLGLYEPGATQVGPAGVDERASREDVQPVDEQRQPIADELGEQGRGERQQGDGGQERELQPAEAPAGAGDVVQLRVLAVPEDPEREKLSRYVTKRGESRMIASQRSSARGSSRRCRCNRTPDLVGPASSEKKEEGASAYFFGAPLRSTSLPMSGGTLLTRVMAQALTPKTTASR